jgi:hypothetical protein
MASTFLSAPQISTPVFSTSHTSSGSMSLQQQVRQVLDAPPLLACLYRGLIQSPTAPSRQRDMATRADRNAIHY